MHGDWGFDEDGDDELEDGFEEPYDDDYDEDYDDEPAKEKGKLPNKRTKFGTRFSLKDIKLAKPAPKLLEKAIKLLKKPNLLMAVRLSEKISHYAFINSQHSKYKIGGICHASVDNELIPHRRNLFNYRYYINWSNPHRKKQYYSSNISFTAEQAEAVRNWYNWLRNYSHWSRFFVGPTDIETLYNCGCISDLSAPSFVLHFMAVAWRVPGEYVELIEAWYDLVSVGYEPHFALGMANNTTRFDKADCAVSTFYSPGHNLFERSVSIEGLARFFCGVPKISKDDLIRAKKNYDMCYSDLYLPAGSVWRDKVPDYLKNECEVADGWTRTARKSKKLLAGTFIDFNGAGREWIKKEVYAVISQNKWDHLVPTQPYERIK